jgi:DNA-directed RNA polymerase subunit omega
MSIYPSPDKLDALESKYALVILAAKRARQIKDNARRLVESRSTNPLTAALEEIAEGAIIPRIVEDATVAAHQAALKPADPSLEDIIGAGPVLALDTEQDSAAAQLAAFRNAEPDSDDEDLVEEERLDRSVDAFALDAPHLVNDADDEVEEEDE